MGQNKCTRVPARPDLARECAPAPETELTAEIDLVPAGSRAVHFRLRDVLIDGVPVPDGLLQPVMAGVGDSYPALTSSGRDLYVEVPPGGRITLTPDSVSLTRP